mgnify:CR=1 FL=1
MGKKVAFTFWYDTNGEDDLLVTMGQEFAFEHALTRADYLRDILQVVTLEYNNALDSLEKTWKEQV